MKSHLACLLLSAFLAACHHPGPPAPGTEKAPERYQIRTVVFYNVENLFDTENDSLTDDDARTTGGSDHWTQVRYELKLDHLSRVLSEVGADQASRLPDLIGLCEVENRRVLEDLLNREPLRRAGYGIIHHDSPDRRGIDVALLYKKSCFTPLETASRRLLLYDGQNRRNYTRDQLVVFGILDGEPLFLSVNHWPSRSGGQAATEGYRKEAASLQRRILDSILRLEPDARFLSMGDYNDDPTDPSLKYGLRTRMVADSLLPGMLYNPMESLYLSGAGTLAYRDRWNLFDQLLFNGNWFSTAGSYRYWKAEIFRPAYLLTSEGPYKGYPFRTYAGGSYHGGYSDHLPVCAYLLRKIEE